MPPFELILRMVKSVSRRDGEGIKLFDGSPAHGVWGQQWWERTPKKAQTRFERLGSDSPDPAPRDINVWSADEFHCSKGSLVRLSATGNSAREAVEDLAALDFWVRDASTDMASAASLPTTTKKAAPKRSKKKTTAAKSKKKGKKKSATKKKAKKSTKQGKKSAGSRQRKLAAKKKGTKPKKKAKKASAKKAKKPAKPK